VDTEAAKFWCVLFSVTKIILMRIIRCYNFKLIFNLTGVNMTVLAISYSYRTVFCDGPCHCEKSTAKSSRYMLQAIDDIVKSHVHNSATTLESILVQQKRTKIY